MILLPGCQVGNTEVITKKILKALQKPFIINGNQLYITTSIGVAYILRTARMDTLIKKADAYVQGKGGWELLLRVRR